MSRFCLDTSAYSNFMRGEASVVALLEGSEWAGVCSVVVGELWAGFLRGSRPRENQKHFLDFLSHPAVHEIALDRGVALHYAEIVHDLRQAGTPIPTNDVWIAAAAASSGSTVLTYDRHFQQITRVGAIILEAD